MIIIKYSYYYSVTNEMPNSVILPFYTFFIVVIFIFVDHFIYHLKAMNFLFQILGKFITSLKYVLHISNGLVSFSGSKRSLRRNWSV